MSSEAVIFKWSQSILSNPPSQMDASITQLDLDQLSDGSSTDVAVRCGECGVGAVQLPRSRRTDDASFEAPQGARGSSRSLKVPFSLAARCDLPPRVAELTTTTADPAIASHGAHFTPSVA